MSQEELHIQNLFHWLTGYPQSIMCLLNPHGGAQVSISSIKVQYSFINF